MNTFWKAEPNVVCFELPDEDMTGKDLVYRVSKCSDAIGWVSHNDDDNTLSVSGNLSVEDARAIKAKIDEISQEGRTDTCHVTQLL
jgi:hypothetical protein